MKVLYISHIGILGESSRSLFEFLSAFPNHSIDLFVICAKGDFAVMMKKLVITIITSIGIHQFNNTEYGHYTKLSWLIIFKFSRKVCF